MKRTVPLEGHINTCVVSETVDAIQQFEQAKTALHKALQVLSERVMPRHGKIRVTVTVELEVVA